MQRVADNAIELIKFVELVYGLVVILKLRQISTPVTILLCTRSETIHILTATTGDSSHLYLFILVFFIFDKIKR